MQPVWYSLEFDSSAGTFSVGTLRNTERMEMKVPIDGVWVHMTVDEFLEFRDKSNSSPKPRSKRVHDDTYKDSRHPTDRSGHQKLVWEWLVDNDREKGWHQDQVGKALQIKPASAGAAMSRLKCDGFAKHVASKTYRAAFQ